MKPIAANSAPENGDCQVRWRIICLSSRGHPDARGISATITDEATIERRETKKELIEEQARQLGFLP